MTREEAIVYIKEWRKDEYALNGADREVLDMAIEALSADTVSREFYEDAVKANHGLAKENSELKKQIESAEPTDLISRADAIGCLPMSLCYDNEPCVDAIKSLPSADRPHGEWVPCKLVNQCYIPELADCKDKPYLVTYETETGKRFVKKTNIYHGRIQSKENRIIAWMPLPEPYKGGEEE